MIYPTIHLRQMLEITGSPGQERRCNLLAEFLSADPVFQEFPIKVKRTS